MKISPTLMNTTSSKVKLSSLKLAVALFLACATTACSFQFPGVYRLEIQQGNIITQDMVDQLRIGMTKRQVNFVLGTPLVQDSFNQHRWDYYYSLRNSQGNEMNKQFTVYFADEKLSYVEGDYELTNTTPLDEVSDQSASR